MFDYEKILCPPCRCSKGMVEPSKPLVISGYVATHNELLTDKAFCDSVRDIRKQCSDYWQKNKKLHPSWDAADKGTWKYDEETDRRFEKAKKAETYHIAILRYEHTRRIRDWI